MAKKIIFWAMLVMVLAFGMTVFGCEEDIPGVVTIKNGSYFSITDVVFTQDGIVKKSDSSVIAAGSEKEYYFDFDFGGYVEVTVEGKKIISPYCSATPGKGHSTGSGVTLVGNDKNNLKFQ